MKSIAKKDSNQNGKIAREKVVQDVQKMKVSVYKLCQKIDNNCQKIDNNCQKIDNMIDIDSKAKRNNQVKINMQNYRAAKKKDKPKKKNEEQKQEPN